MDKCKSCRYYDTEKSNENWVVCKRKMLMDVMVTGTSENCKNYDPIREG